MPRGRYGNIGGVVFSHYFNKYFGGDAGVVSDTSQQALAGMMQAGCIVGSLFAGWAADHFGRRRSGIYAATCCLVGMVVTATPLLMDCSLFPLFAGRTLLGTGGGMLCTIVPVYVSEVASPAIRGAVEASFQLAVELGILGAYLVNWLVIPVYDDGWKISLAWQIVPGALFLVAMVGLPESPRWLIRHRQDSTGAFDVLCRFRTIDDDVAEEVGGVGGVCVAV